MQIEFYGIPRQRAGVPRLELKASTLADLQVALIAQFPDLADPQHPHQLHPAFALNLNGGQFLSAGAYVPLGESDVVLVLSADAGG